MEEMCKKFLSELQAASGGPTLEEVKSRHIPHGRLVGCSYHASSCGMMYNSDTLLYITVSLRNGQQQIAYTEKQAFQPTIRTEYIPNQDVLAALNELVERENLAAWSVLEYHDPFKCTDYSSSASIDLRFDDSSLGGSKSALAVIKVSAACQHGGGDVIQQFRNILETAVQNAKVLSSTKFETANAALGMMGMMAMPPQSAEVPETVLPDGAWKCPNCGFDSNTGKFCVECGTKRVPPLQPDP